MKKFLTSILAILYLSTSMGATIHLHYCMGKLISWGLMNHESVNCDYCGMPKSSSGAKGLTIKNNCCKDEHKLFKTDKDQKAATGEIQVLKLVPEAVVVPILSFNQFRISTDAVKNPTAHAPPLIGNQPVFLLNCNFRI